MACLYCNNGWYYLQVKDRGRTVRTSLRTKDRRVALAVLRRHNAQKELGVLPGPRAAKMLVGAAIDEWMLLRSPLVSAKQLRRLEVFRGRVEAGLRDLGVTFLDDLTTEDVKAFASRRLAAGAAPKTVLQELIVLRGAVRVFEASGRAAPKVVWPRVGRRPVRPETLGAYSPEQVAALLDHFAGRPERDFILCLAATGARLSEVLGIRAQDVDLAGKVLRLCSRKTAVSPRDWWRHVAIHPDLAPVLRRRMAGLAPDGLVFPPPAGRVGWLTERLQRACRALGIPWRRLHGLRHSAITWALQRGVGAFVVKEAAGHRSLSTTMGYAHVASTGFVEALPRFPEKTKPRGKPRGPVTGGS